MSLKTLLVAPTAYGTLVRKYSLSIAPFPGLGIRLDVYDMVNVDSVVVGDAGHDVTCVVSPDPRDTFDEERWLRLGFEPGPYP